MLSRSLLRAMPSSQATAGVAASSWKRPEAIASF